MNTLARNWLVWLMILACAPFYIACLISPLPMFGRLESLVGLAATMVVGLAGLKILDLRANEREDETRAQ